MIKISGAWTNPEVVGQCMMLIGSFVMEKLSNTSAIMFGGSELDSAAGSVYIVDISISRVASRVVCRLHVHMPLCDNMVHMYAIFTIKARNF